MIGIYKYTNKINNKTYIGLSNNIERRKHEHQYFANCIQDTYFHKALHKYGIENFDFEILETFETNDRTLLGQREQYWIQYYDSYKNGYNETIGGDIVNGRAKLTESDVIAIRLRYANLERCMIVYEDYKERIGRTGFNKIWKGETWKNIMPEVYTEERKEYHKNNTGNVGGYNGRTKLTEEDVRNIRIRHKNGESSSQIYKDYSDKITKGSFQNIISYQNWKHIKV